MTGTFLDTSALYAAARPNDTDHAPCSTEYRRLLRSAGPLVTTELILAELHALALARVGPERALALVTRLAASTRIDTVAIDEALRDRALDLLSKRPGRACSLADAVSFEVMRDHHLDAAFTLDGDFAVEGFRVVPAQ